MAQATSARSFARQQQMLKVGSAFRSEQLQRSGIRVDDDAVRIDNDQSAIAFISERRKPGSFKDGAGRIRGQRGAVFRGLRRH
jgi:hypothetical protein